MKTPACHAERILRPHKLICQVRHNRPQKLTLLRGLGGAFGNRVGIDCRFIARRSITCSSWLLRSRSPLICVARPHNCDNCLQLIEGKSIVQADVKFSGRPREIMTKAIQTAIWLDFIFHDFACAFQCHRRRTRLRLGMARRIWALCRPFAQNSMQLRRHAIHSRLRNVPSIVEVGMRPEIQSVAGINVCLQREYAPLLRLRLGLAQGGVPSASTYFLECAVLYWHARPPLVKLPPRLLGWLVGHFGSFVGVASINSRLHVVPFHVSQIERCFSPCSAQSSM